jgi:hypothetical protein
VLPVKYLSSAASVPQCPQVHRRVQRPAEVRWSGMKIASRAAAAGHTVGRRRGRPGMARHVRPISSASRGVTGTR